MKTRRRSVTNFCMILLCYNFHINCNTCQSVNVPYLICMFIKAVTVYLNLQLCHPSYLVLQRKPFAFELFSVWQMWGYSHLAQKHVA